MLQHFLKYNPNINLLERVIKFFFFLSGFPVAPAPDLPIRSLKHIFFALFLDISLRNQKVTSCSSAISNTSSSWSWSWSARTFSKVTATTTPGRVRLCRSWSESCRSCLRTGSTSSPQCDKETFFKNVIVFGKGSKDTAVKPQVAKWSWMIDTDIQTTLSSDVNQTLRHCRDFFLFPTKSYVFKLLQHHAHYNLNSDTIIQSYTDVCNPAAATAAQRSVTCYKNLDLHNRPKQHQCAIVDVTCEL